MNTLNSKKNKISANNKIKLSNIINQSDVFFLHNINNKKQLLTKISSIVEDHANFSKKEILGLILV